MYVCVLEACSARRGQKRALDPLELEFQMLVTCPVGAGWNLSGLEELLSLSYLCSPCFGFLQV